MTGEYRQTPFEIVVVGRDVAVWFTALALRQNLAGHGIFVGVVELPGMVQDWECLPASPRIKRAHALLGLDEIDIVSTTGSVSLGQEFVNFSRGSSGFFVPFGDVGTTVDGMPFVMSWLRARRQGMTVAYDEFSLNAAAARSSKVFRSEEVPHPFQASDHGYHLHAPSYVALLRRRAIAAGVTVRTATAMHIVREASSGDIGRIMLEDGQAIRADLFVDASGPDAFLLGKGLAAPRVPLAHVFPFRRVVSAAIRRPTTLPAYAQTRASAAGITHLHAMPGHTALRYAFDPERTPNDVAGHMVTALGEPVAGITPGYIDLRPGYHRPWHGNVVGIGAAAAQFDSDNGELDLIHCGVAHLLADLPVDRPAAASRDRYNAAMTAIFETVRDLRQAHYTLNRVRDRGIWERQNDTPPSPSLAARIAAFAEDGTIPPDAHSHVRDEEWRSIFLGHGLIPRSYDPRADAVPEDDAKALMRALLRAVAHAVAHMRSSDDRTVRP